MTVQGFSAAVAFFRKHAGYSVAQGETLEEGKLRGARELAAAEAWLVGQPHQVEWREDDDADRSWLPKRDKRPLFGCLVSVKQEGEWVHQSLWGIDLGPTGNECDSYMRVVVAELAMELMP